MPAPHPAVLTEGLTKSFGDTDALSDLNLTIAPGEALGLLGHNGAGKTTAVRILATLLRPDGGRAFVDGHDVVADPGAARQKLALAGQQATLDDRLTGRENLVLLGRLQRLSAAAAKLRAGELLERFDLTSAADRLAGTYSGGMRRRLDLAACLVVPRPVVFLDEPTTGLDPVSRAGVWATVREFVDGGAALLLTTQYLEEADQLADRITVLAGGRMVAEGTPSELKDRVGGRRVEVQLAAGVDLAAAADALTEVGLEPSIETRARVVSAAAPSGEDDLSRALAAFERAAIRVDEIGLRRPTLDDAFFALADGEAPADPLAELAVSNGRMTEEAA